MFFQQLTAKNNIRTPPTLMLSNRCIKSYQCFFAEDHTKASTTVRYSKVSFNTNVIMKVLHITCLDSNKFSQYLKTAAIELTFNYFQSLQTDKISHFKIERVKGNLNYFL